MKLDSIPVPLVPRYLNIGDAARYLGISVWTLYRLVAKRQIPFIALTPSNSHRETAKKPMIRFDVRALDRWMETQAIEALR
jgi:hypothetical protein